MERWLFRGVFGATALLYAVILLWSAPRIAAAAGGLPIFDLRPAGYSTDEARAFLAALSPAGRSFYRDVQLRLDAVYPVAFALCFGWAVLRMLPPGRHRGLLLLPPVLAAAFDLAENALVARMLDAGAGGVDPDLVASASAATQAKAALTTLTFAIVLLATLAAWRRDRDGRGAP